MNPFDNQELVVFDKTMREDMPYHRDNRIEIKRQFSQGLPKNAKEYSTKINDKFLNDNLHLIEEMHHRKPDNYIAKWFHAYQKKIYGKTEILNHDNFFKAKLPGHGCNIFQDEFGMPKGTRYSPNHGNAFTSFAAAVNGAELEFDTGGTTGHANGPDNLVIEKEDSIVCIPTQLYDQMAFNFRIASGNTILGIYDTDGSDDADNLLGTTGSFSTAVNYDFHSMTEFAMTTAIFFGASVSSASGTGGFGNLAVANTRQFKSFTFGALPDPAGSIGGYSEDTFICQTMKFSHT